jgi:nickel-dependent lactate racemase
MKIELPFGNSTLAFDIPDGNVGDIIRHNPVRTPGDVGVEIKNALQNPTGCAPLRQMAKKGQSVCVICEDITRNTPTQIILKHVISELLAGGVEKSGIFIVMALGTHRPMTRAEMAVKAGEEILREYPVYNSEFSDKKGLSFLGRMQGDIPLYVDKRVMGADLRVSVGSIVPHPAAGFSGGAKIIIPGVTGEETVAAFHHAYGGCTLNMFGSDDFPIRLEMEKWVEKIGLHFSVNAVTTPEKKIYRIAAGHFIQAHRKGMEYAKEVFGVHATQRAGLAVINSCPADLDLWQATKAFGSGLRIVRERGTLLLVTPCPEGLGPHARLAEYMGRGDDPEWLAENLERLPVAERIPLSGGRTLARWRRSMNLAVYSPGLTQADMEKAKIEYVRDVQSYIDLKLAAAGPLEKVSVIHFGGETYAYL